MVVFILSNENTKQKKSFQNNNLKKRNKLFRKLSSFEKIQLKRYYKVYLDGKWMY